MPANSWFNAKPAKSGSMGFAWAISQRTKFMMMITTVNNVGPNYMSSFSSGTIIFFSYSLFLNLFSRKLAKRPRQASAASRQDPANSRVSRSHSPGHLNKQPSKRRNTMNSRDAAFDESLKEIIEATAAEAAAVHDSFIVSPNETEPVEVVSGGKKKRKRTDDDR